MLKDIIKKQRTTDLLRNFVEKIKRNVANSQAVDENRLRLINEEKRKGWKISD